MSSLEQNMKKILLPLLLASLGLGGCIAVPVDGYGYAPAVVVRPGFHGHYRDRDGDRGRNYR
jgi:hypothetical protein